MAMALMLISLPSAAHVHYAPADVGGRQGMCRSAARGPGDPGTYTEVWGTSEAECRQRCTAKQANFRTPINFPMPSDEKSSLDRAQLWVL